MKISGREILENKKKIVKNKEIDMILHVGDWAYDLFTDNGDIGDKFMDEIEPLTSSLPYMGCLGNHEGKYNFSHWNNRFVTYNQIGVNSKSGSNNWYFSWEIISGGALIHYTSISSEVYFRNYDEPMPVQQQKDQYAWVQKDLEDARNRGVDWIIVYGHRPMYCSNVGGDDCSKDATDLREGINKTYGMEDLLKKYNVDLYFCGHEHSYERTFPVYKGEPDIQSNNTYINPKYPVHIITGSAGNEEDLGDFDDVLYGRWSAVRSSTYGYGHLIIYNNTHLYWEQLLDEGKGGKDILWIVKDSDIDRF